MRRLLLIPLCGLAALPALADTPPASGAPALSTWSGTGSGGYLRTSGNTNTTAANVKAELDFTSAPWSDALTASGDSGRSSGVTTQERYSAGDKGKFNFNDLDYVFANFTYDSDRFNGIQQNIVESFGYGRRILQTEKQILDAEIGVGASEERLAPETTTNSSGQTVVVEPKENKTQPILTLGGKYIYNLTKTSSFSQTLRAEIGSDNTFINPVTELKMQVIGHLTAALDYEVRYNTSVPTGTHNSDIITSINFGYAFGGKKL